MLALAWSIKNDLIEKSKEAMLSAIQIYNNPQIKFKSEIYKLAVPDTSVIKLLQLRSLGAVFLCIELCLAANHA